MSMQTFKQAYIQKTEETKRSRAEIEDQITKKEEKVQRLQKQIEKLKEKEIKVHYPSWIDELVEPIAKFFAEEFGMDYEIFGPFGMRGQLTIYWKKEKDVSIVDQSCKYLRLVPLDLKDAELGYETGNDKDGKPYDLGSSDPNGFQREVKPLPDSFEEIRNLIKE